MSIAGPLGGLPHADAIAGVWQAGAPRACGGLVARQDGSRTIARLWGFWRSDERAYCGAVIPARRPHLHSIAPLSVAVLPRAMSWFAQPLRAFAVTALAATLCAAVCADEARADTRFLTAFDDVPLAPGLTERADAAFTFAAPEGRIEEATATGAAQEGTVRAYYRDALPALGWALNGDAADMVFVRGRERLTLVFVRGSDGALRVRYRVIARPASLALD